MPSAINRDEFDIERMGNDEHATFSGDHKTEQGNIIQGQFHGRVSINESKCDVLSKRS